MRAGGGGGRAGLPAAGNEGFGDGGDAADRDGLTGGKLAFRQHAGGHTTGPNWPAFLTFAERYFTPRRKRR